MRGAAGRGGGSVVSIRSEGLTASSLKSKNKKILIKKCCEVLRRFWREEGIFDVIDGLRGSPSVPRVLGAETDLPGLHPGAPPWGTTACRC